MRFPGQLRFLWLSVVVLVIDLMTKQIANHYLSRFIAYQVFPGFNLVLVHNQGAAFGFLHGQGGWQTWLFTCIAVVIVVALIIWLVRLRRNQTWLAIAIALVIGGAVGNMIDRVILGYVVDFLDFYIGQYHWPAFNFADTCITIGAILIIWRLWRGKA